MKLVFSIICAWYLRISQGNLFGRGQWRVSSTPRVGSLFRTPNDELYIIDKLGKGSYGTVYKCRSKRLGGREVALKVENANLWSSLLEGKPRPAYKKIEYEHHMLQALQGNGYPQVFDFNFQSKVKYMVMETVGRDLNSLAEQRHGYRVPRETVCLIAIQLLTYLERIHDIGIIVYDIHGGNVMIQVLPTGELLVRLIDPGMAFYFIVNGRHIEKTPSPVPSYDKNPAWTCIDDDAFIIPSRRCEIERVLIMLLQNLVGELPWERMISTHSYEAIAAYKKSLTSKQLCSHPSSQFMTKAFDYVASLQYKQRPDYNSLRALFQTQLVIDQRSRMQQGFVGYR